MTPVSNIKVKRFNRLLSDIWRDDQTGQGFIPLGGGLYSICKAPLFETCLLFRSHAVTQRRRHPGCLSVGGVPCLNMYI